MIERYTRKHMGKIWEPASRFRTWLNVEILVCEALCELGQIPKDALENIKSRASFDVDRILEIEKTVKHDVVAFLTNVSEYVGDDARYIHLGLTSSDILDTSFAVLLKESAGVILKDLDDLLAVLKTKAHEYKDLAMVGRTHGIQAEPITFGLKLALWYDEMERNVVRMERAKEAISCGKISGAVGTYDHIPPSVENYVCEKLGLRPARASNQILSRDLHAEYFTTLAVIATSVEKFALEIRHLQRTEVGEAEEPFSAGQKGSSAMPHKRNPILSENLCGLARIVRANAFAALENVPLWHERDISHSSAERIIGPDSTILVDFMLARFTGVLKGLNVYPEAMAKNLERSQGLIFSQRVLLELAKRGMGREDAYAIVQRCAMKSLNEGLPFKGLLEQDEKVRETLPPQELERLFSLEASLKHVDETFDRVFGKS